MTLPPLTPPPPAGSLLPFVSDQNLVYLVIGLVVFLLFVLGSRFVSNRVVAALRRRNMRSDMVQIGGRVVTVVLIALGIWFAIGFAFQSQNFTLAGILLATIVASFGVQDLLKDYVSGYYVLLERHIRVGDRISMEGLGAGTVTEIKLRVTLLKADSGDLLVVPNSELFNKAVTVHVRAAERAAETKSETNSEASSAPPG
jgi:small conductance mechanosensitive channel